MACWLIAASFAGANRADGAAPGVPALGNDPAAYVDYAVSDLPSYFTTGQLAALDNTPANNAITDAGAELGRVLFYDARLSHNNGVACASCHTQETGFSDPAQFSTGFEGGLTGRHSPGLSNAAYYTNRETGLGSFFWDERADSLEEQVLGPIQDAVEMGSNLTDLVAELNETEYYPVLFERAFGDSSITSDRLSKALAQFVRSMASYQSPFDQAIAAGSEANPNFDAVESIENPALVEAGHTLFGQRCGNCHRTSAQVADNTHNVGLPSIDADADGDLDENLGAGGGEYKVPSLRNIAVRGRYMHDGRFESLEDVIDFYSSGVEANGHPLSADVRNGGFNFTTPQKAALLAFMETFTDTEFLMSELFSNPLVTLAGDYDGSGVVDMDDLVAWQTAYGLTEDDVSGPLYADGNGDGLVNAADYSLWRDNLGARWDDGMAALAAAVPEPATALIAAMLLSAIGTRQRSRG